MVDLEKLPSFLNIHVTVVEYVHTYRAYFSDLMVLSKISISDANASVLQ